MTGFWWIFIERCAGVCYEILQVRSRESEFPPAKKGQQKGEVSWAFSAGNLADRLKIININCLWNRLKTTSTLERDFTCLGSHGWKRIDNSDTHDIPLELSFVCLRVWYIVVSPRSNPFRNRFLRREHRTPQGVKIVSFGSPYPLPIAFSACSDKRFPI